MSNSNPGILNLLKCKCPRCRIGDMFQYPNVYNFKKFMLMNDQCDVCKQHFDIEVGFYYGSSYVSYGLTVFLSVVTLVIWYFLIGFSATDNRIFYWVITNGVLLIILQPWLMRFSRTLWLSFFVKYNPNWRTEEAPLPERLNKSQKNAW